MLSCFIGELKKCPIEIKESQLMAFGLCCGENIWAEVSGVLHKELDETVVWKHV